MLFLLELGCQRNLRASGKKVAAALRDKMKPALRRKKFRHKITVYLYSIILWSQGDE